MDLDITTASSVFDESEWSKLFPPASSALGNEKNNIKFLKKLIAVAVSNIVYLRAELPEESFTKRNLGSLELRMLQKIKGSPELPTNVLIEMIKDGMSAIDKGFLRKLTIVIFDGEEDAQKGDMRNAFETYGFYFGPQDKNFSLSLSSKNKGDVPVEEVGNMPNDLTEEYVLRSVKKLLRRIIAGTQELDVLPDVAFLTVCLEYYDEITPADYQPKGYEHSEYTPQLQYAEGENGDPHYCGMGQVDMMHQKMALRLKSKARALTPEDELHPASLERASQENAYQAVNVSEEALNESADMEVETATLSKKDAKKRKQIEKRKQLEEEQQQAEMEYRKHSKRYAYMEPSV